MSYTLTNDPYSPPLLKYPIKSPAVIPLRVHRLSYVMCAPWLELSAVLEIRFVTASPDTAALLVQECLKVFDLTKVCKSLG